ncbi:uncharacterized protein OsI_027940-like [Wolffia australiana]
MSRHPEVKWAERADEVYLTIILPDARNVNADLQPEGILTFSANAGAENHLYELKFNLHDKINVQESKINTSARKIFCLIKKAESRWWRKLLRDNEKPPHYLKVDWEKWADEEDETGTGGLDFEGEF